MGIELGAVTSGNPEAIQHLCRLAQLPENAFSKTTVHKISTMRYSVRGEEFDTFTFDRGLIRVCPECIREQHSRSADIWSVIHHLHWQITQIRSCTKHDVRLVGLGEPKHGFGRLDATAAIKAYGVDTAIVGEHALADDFDIYLTNRTYNPENRYWCDKFSIPALWRCSEALGISLTYGVSQTRTSGLTDAELRAATLRGFRLLKAGKEATTSALASFAATTTAGCGHRSKPRYGEILRLLNKTSDYQEHLEIMRDFMRAYIVDRYPLDDDVLLFGKPIGKRRLHSMISAQRSLGMSQKLLKDLLVARGLGERDGNGKFRLVTLLTVEVVEDLLAEKLRYVGNEEAFGLLCVFRGHPASDSESIRPPIPILSGH